MTAPLTCGMCAAFIILIENLQRLRRERRPSLAFLGRHKTDEVTKVLRSILIPLLGHRHPPLQHRLYLLRTLRRNVQLLKPTSPSSPSLSCCNTKRDACCFSLQDSQILSLLWQCVLYTKFYPVQNWFLAYFVKNNTRGNWRHTFSLTVFSWHSPDHSYIPGFSQNFQVSDQWPSWLQCWVLLQNYPLSNVHVSQGKSSSNLLKSKDTRHPHVQIDHLRTGQGCWRKVWG